MSHYDEPKIQLRKNLIIKLNRLTASDISEYTDPKLPSSEKPTIEMKQNVEAGCSSETVETCTRTTRSATNKSRNDIAATKKPINEEGRNVGAGYSSKAVEMYTHKTRSTTNKRRNDVDSTKLTDGKKTKLSENLPATEIQEISETQNTQLTEKIQTVAALDYQIDEIVWGKNRGWPHWPAKIISIDNRRCNVEWCNDYRKSKLFKTQLFKFSDDNFKNFAKKFPTSIGLQTAAKEALILIASKSRV